VGTHQEQPGAGLPDRLRTALIVAMGSRDTVAVAAIRSALAAIGNAEAVQPPAGPAGAAGRQHGTDSQHGAGRQHGTDSQHVAGAAHGAGATETARRALTVAQVSQIVAAEIADRQTAATQYDALGRTSQADRLRREAAALIAIAGPQAREQAREG
jgi:uncharacterized protein YqeY